MVLSSYEVGFQPDRYTMKRKLCREILVQTFGTKLD